MGVFGDLIMSMAQMDAFQVIFPWLLMSAVVYGALEKYEVFEEQAINGSVSIGMSFLAVAGIYMFFPAGLFPNFAAAISFAVMGILGLIVLSAIGGYDFAEDDENDVIPKASIVIVVISFIGAILFQADVLSMFPSIDIGEDFVDNVVMPIVMLAFIVVLVAVTARGGSTNEEDQ